MNFTVDKALNPIRTEDYILNLILANIKNDQWSFDEKLLDSEVIAKMNITISGEGFNYEVNEFEVIITLTNHIESLEKKISKIQALVNEEF